jgi:hypothetical protein
MRDFHGGSTHALTARNRLLFVFFLPDIWFPWQCSMAIGFAVYGFGHNHYSQVAAGWPVNCSSTRCHRRYDACTKGIIGAMAPIRIKAVLQDFSRQWEVMNDPPGRPAPSEVRFEKATTFAMRIGIRWMQPEKMPLSALCKPEFA